MLLVNRDCAGELNNVVREPVRSTDENLKIRPAADCGSAEMVLLQK